MLSEQAKKTIIDLALPYSPVAIKFCRNRPKDYQPIEDSDAFCGYLKKAQVENKAFFTTKENDRCMGKVVLGMVELESNHGSGQVGYESGLFRTAAANARLYHEVTFLKNGVCNFVVFCPIDQCDFYPDLVICVAPPETAQLILRATSYNSGDIWESKSSYVLSCSWTYTYPYVSGKVNHLFTGMHSGLNLRKAYPPGLHIITIPYQKLDEVVLALNEMDRVPILLREDDESKQKLGELMTRIEALSKNIDLSNKI